MTQRASELHATADGQIAELLGLIAMLDEASLRMPCPGRAKLGDGTAAASAQHTADNYQRIATFIQTSEQMSDGHQPTQHGAHRTPRFLRALRHAPQDHGAHGPAARQHEADYTADKFDRRAILEQLSASRQDFARVAKLTDTQLDAIPPKDSFRFCDGQRTLDQVLTSLLRHQRHQLDALKVVRQRVHGQPVAALQPRDHGQA
jgi:hypothetical protein